MRPSVLAALGCLVCSALGCSTGPAYVSLGEQESYCASASDCEPGLFCVSIDGSAFCTAACASDDDCGTSYTCGRPEGICRPVRDGVCRREEERCGPSFEACCTGTCAMFAPFGSFCTTSCTGDWDCQSGCCVDAGSNRVCAPPSYC